MWLSDSETVSTLLIEYDVVLLKTNPLTGSLLGGGKIWFLLIGSAFIVGMSVVGIEISRKKKKEEAPAAPPAPSKEEVLLTEIRDLLKEKK